jgi:hypothetical protein
MRNTESMDSSWSLPSNALVGGGNNKRLKMQMDLDVTELLYKNLDFVKRMV